MPKFTPDKPRGTVNFYCRTCVKTFDAQPLRVDPDLDPERAYHPFVYVGQCPKCHAEVGQAPWDKALQKAWLNATGPKTIEGKAAAARNLDGHPTPEETQRTRFNALKHGLNARTATYFPAKPDGYAFCEGCDVDRVYCAAQPACIKRTELFMLHHAAFEQGDPDRLQGIYADMQAALLSVVQQIIQTIIADGVQRELPEYYKDKDGEIVVAQFTNDAGEQKILMREVAAHPLFKPLGELLSRNNLSLADMGMTAKAIGDREEAMGRLAADSITQDSLLEFQARQAKALENISAMISRARSQAEQDPALIEHNLDAGEPRLISK